MPAHFFIYTETEILTKKIIVYGCSIYNDGVTLTNYQGYSARENGEYVDGYNNNITQAENIFANGAALSQIANSDAAQNISLIQQNIVANKVISDRLTTAFSMYTVLRATATGSTELKKDGVSTVKVSAEELKAIAAKSMRLPENEISEAATPGKWHIFEGTVKSRLCGIFEETAALCLLREKTVGFIGTYFTGTNYFSP